ncbi:MAG: glycosyltransferase family 2 protein [Burkholderiales bacterium]|nr:glycosyltransferase family 2 protein [Burkholderiales bacterium]
MISILILTRNEERDLPGCLDSVAWCDDVHVFDSLSTDRTVQIARERGAHVSERPFDNYAAQRNAALKTLPFRHPWLFILDADERIPAEMTPALQAFVQSAPPGTDAARLRRRDFLFGRWLKHCQMSPFYIRLVRLGKVHYEREINEVLKVDGQVVDLPGHFDHFPFSKGVEHWFAKHNQYSSMEARELMKTRMGEYPLSLKTALFGRDFNERRYHQKELFYRMPFRPLVKFLYLYGLRRGFLDGRAGFSYATMASIYEYMISVKVTELRLAAAEARTAVSPVR